MFISRTVKQKFLIKVYFCLICFVFYLKHWGFTAYFSVIISWFKISKTAVEQCCTQLGQTWFLKQMVFILHFFYIKYLDNTMHTSMQKFETNIDCIDVARINFLWCYLIVRKFGYTIIHGRTEARAKQSVCARPSNFYIYLTTIICGCPVASMLIFYQRWRLALRWPKAGART